MKAVIWTEYGPPEGLELREVEKPAPKADEILVKVHAASVTAGDCEMRRLALPLSLSLPVRLYAGFRKPKRIRILGQEFSGEIEGMGSGVQSFQVGDEIFGTTGFRFGAYAEYICLPAQPGDAQGTFARKPENLSHQEAAAVPTAGLEALHFIRKAGIQEGKQALIVGGGGSIGTFAIQLAKHFGANVAAVDSTEKLDLIRSLGADRVIDFTKQDYLNNDETYDLIIDVVGRRDIARRLRLLKPDGWYFLAYARLSHILLSLWVSLTSKKKFKIEASSQDKQDLLYLKDLIEEGKLRPVIDKTYSLDQVPEAHRYAESGQKKGNIVITMNKH